MGITNKLVLSSGKLNDKYITKREILYQGTNGMNVERIYLSHSESYIFKPLTNNSQVGQEGWIHEQILSDLPITYPKIIEKDKDNQWLIVEDLGKVEHTHNEEVVFQIINQMVIWQSTSKDKLTSRLLKAPKPFIDEIIADIITNKNKVLTTFVNHQVPMNLIKNIYQLLDIRNFSDTRVFSHGDLHLGNYGISNGRVVVLDWEHAHLNSPYWDLYHLLDMSHPLFPKKTTRELREAAVNYYLEKTDLELQQQSFKEGYYLFSAVFSIFMMLLIEDDLNMTDGKWPKDRLIEQRHQTLSNFVQCSEYLLYELER